MSVDRSVQIECKGAHIDTLEGQVNFLINNQQQLEEKLKKLEKDVSEKQHTINLLEDMVRTLRAEMNYLMADQQKLAEKICGPVVQRLEAQLGYIVKNITDHTLAKPPPPIIMKVDQETYNQVKDRFTPPTTNVGTSSELFCPSCGAGDFYVENFTAGKEWVCSRCKEEE